MPEYDSTILYRDVEGFPGYKVGSDGSVWSCRNNKGKRGKGNGKGSATGFGTVYRKLKPDPGPGGHLRVHLGKERRFVHRLVLEAFIGPCPKRMQACHFPDRNPANCNINNLRWGTHADNENDKEIHGTRPRGENHGNCTVADHVVDLIRELHSSGLRQADVARILGLSNDYVWKVVHGVSRLSR
jgi:hypothetical protein